MNWTDIAVILLIGGFALFGYSSGFMLSIFRFGSFFISSILAIKLYPVLSGILAKTAVYTNIQTSIFNKLMLQQPNVDNQAKVAGSAAVDNLRLPGFIKDIVKKGVEKSLNLSELFDLSSIMRSISEQLADVVIDIISLIILFIAIRIGLIFLRFIIKGVSKLPLIKQFDKLSGFALGAFEGLLMVYIILALVMLFNATQLFQGVYTAVDNSLFAKILYENNFIINWMFPSA